MSNSASKSSNEGKTASMSLCLVTALLTAGLICAILGRVRSKAGFAESVISPTSLIACKTFSGVSSPVELRAENIPSAATAPVASSTEMFSSFASCSSFVAPRCPAAEITLFRRTEWADSGSLATTENPLRTIAFGPKGISERRSFSGTLPPSGICI